MSNETTNWPELAISLYDKLTGRGAEITYTFHQLEVWVPSSTSQDSPKAHWKVNGTIKVRTKDSSD